MPVRATFAITINEARGKSLELCGFLLDTDCSAHGKFDVELCKVCEPYKFFICVDDGKIKNVSLPQVLSKLNYDENIFNVESLTHSMSMWCYSSGTLQSTNIFHQFLYTILIKTRTSA